MPKNHRRAEGDALIHDLTVGSVSKKLLVFAFPLFLSGLLQTAYNMVDMIVVGHYVGNAGLSAVATGGDVLIFLTFVASGFSNAGQVLIAQFIGADRRDLVGRLIGTIFSFLLICSVALTALCLLLQNQVISWMQVPEVAEGHALHYIVTCACGLVFIYGYNIVSAILRGMGNSKHPFIFIGIAAVTNIVLDLLFVAVFHWDVFGVALATVISQALSFILSLVFLYRRREEFCFDFKLRSFRIDSELFPKYIKLGLPMMLQLAGISFSKLFITSWVNSYSVITSSLNGISNKLYSLAQAYNAAIQTACASMIAQTLSAGKLDRIPKIIRSAMIMALTLTGLVIIALLVFPEAIFNIFTTDEDVLEMALGGFVPVLILMFLAAALRAPMLGLINGSGRSKLNLAIGLIDGIIMRIGLALLMGLTFNMGVYGFWYGSSISGFVPFVIGGVYFISGRWKRGDYLPHEARRE